MHKRRWLKVNDGVYAPDPRCRVPKKLHPKTVKASKENQLIQIMADPKKWLRG